MSFDGGDLDCGNGLLLLIRKHIDPLVRGGLLEIRSTEISVEEDLPAWCRLTGNELVSFVRTGDVRSFLVCKGSMSERTRKEEAVVVRPVPLAPEVPKVDRPSPVPGKVPSRSVFGIGSWPRPKWLVRALHEKLEGRLPDAEFQAAADDAVRLAVEAQRRAGVGVVTDGEQRRDSYATFVGGRLDNCQLIPLTDLLPLVDHPEQLSDQFKSLDVPASEVRHPAVFGKLGRSRPIAGHELAFARSLTSAPVKVAIPGPYLLSRVMWMECISDKAYASREELAADIVRVLREEVAELLEAGAALVQLDEPVLTEVVHAGPSAGRTFMCGALSEKREVQAELEFARDLINAVVKGTPKERTALHVCRGNWTPDESAALTGDYRPLTLLFRNLDVGHFFLELCTPRAGEMEVLRALPDDRRIGVGVVNQKVPQVESVDEILARARKAVDLFGRDRVLFHPDCGFATFADNPVASAAVAEEKLGAIVQAVERL